MYGELKLELQVFTMCTTQQVDASSNPQVLRDLSGSCYTLFLPFICSERVRIKLKLNLLLNMCTDMAQNQILKSLNQSNHRHSQGGKKSFVISTVSGFQPLTLIRLKEHLWRKQTGSGRKPLKRFLMFMRDIQKNPPKAVEGSTWVCV